MCKIFIKKGISLNQKFKEIPFSFKKLFKLIVKHYLVNALVFINIIKDLVTCFYIKFHIYDFNRAFTFYFFLK